MPAPYTWEVAKRGRKWLKSVLYVSGFAADTDSGVANEMIGNLHEDFRKNRFNDGLKTSEVSRKFGSYEWFEDENCEQKRQALSGLCRRL